MRNGLRVVDLFAGAGGFGLGFKLDGNQIIASVEMDRWACQTLEANASPGERVVQADITQLDASRFAKEVGPIDLLIGGPPCQGFSVAGGVKDASDPRNSLFRDFARMASALKPMMLVLENVPGLLTRNTESGARVIDVIKNEFSSLGYVVHHALLQAQDFGVPQIRQRLFVFGFHPSLLAARNWQPPQPTHGETSILGPTEPYVTLWDAIGDLPDPGHDDAPVPYRPSVNRYQEKMRQGSGGAANHVAMKHTARSIERFKKIPCGGSQSDVQDADLRPRKRLLNSSGNTYDQNNRRMHPGRPCHTLPAAFYANFLHPYEHRNFTAREGARIQSFPDSYIFKGLRTTPSHSLLRRENRLDEIGLCQYNQIGNAVAPLVAFAISQHIRKWMEYHFEQSA